MMEALRRFFANHPKSRYQYEALKYGKLEEGPCSSEKWQLGLAGASLAVASLSGGLIGFALAVTGWIVAGDNLADCINEKCGGSVDVCSGYAAKGVTFRVTERVIKQY
jgi:hypothetical protein